MAKTNAPESRNYKSAPTPGGNFIKLAVGMSVEGVLESATMETEKRKIKGKVHEKDRYHFALKLDRDTTVLVGKAKHESEKEFPAGSVVILPEHGFLITTLKRTACEIAGKAYSDEEPVDLSVLVGAAFKITRLEDGEIASGPFAGKASALYDVKYEASVAA